MSISKLVIRLVSIIGYVTGSSSLAKLRPVEASIFIYFKPGCPGWNPRTDSEFYPVTHVIASLFAYVTEQATPSTITETFVPLRPYPKICSV